jgi:hypothetical protein
MVRMPLSPRGYPLRVGYDGCVLVLQHVALSFRQKLCKDSATDCGAVPGCSDTRDATLITQAQTVIPLSMLGVFVDVSYAPGPVFGCPGALGKNVARPLSHSATQLLSHRYSVSSNRL